MAGAAGRKNINRPMSTNKATAWKSILLRHETILLLVLVGEWFYFNSVGPRFGSLDNTFDIMRHSMEIGLLALVMTPIIITGGIDLSDRLTVGVVRDSFWQALARCRIVAVDGGNLHAGHRRTRRGVECHVDNATAFAAAHRHARHVFAFSRTRGGHYAWGGYLHRFSGFVSFLGTGTLAGHARANADFHRRHGGNLVAGASDDIWTLVSRDWLCARSGQVLGHSGRTARGIFVCTNWNRGGLGGNYLYGAHS